MRPPVRIAISTHPSVIRAARNPQFLDENCPSGSVRALWQDPYGSASQGG